MYIIYLVQLDQVMTQIICDCAFKVIALNYNLTSFFIFPCIWMSMQKPFAPKKYFSIDRVFRNEAVDRTHLAEFHQIEGM